MTVKDLLKNNYYPDSFRGYNYIRWFIDEYKVTLMNSKTIQVKRGDAVILSKKIKN